MEFRQATPADIPALAQLNDQVQQLHAAAFPERFRLKVPPAEMERALLSQLQAPAAYWLVAEEEQVIVGFLSAEFRDRPETWCTVAQRICYLAGLAVAPAARRRGVARALLGELSREVAARGAMGPELDVWAFNEGAQAFFRSCGFRTVMERMSLSVGGLATAVASGPATT